jgi:hypothetical protein
MFARPPHTALLLLVLLPAALLMLPLLLLEVGVVSGMYSM